MHESDFIFCSVLCTAVDRKETFWWNVFIINFCAVFLSRMHANFWLGIEQCSNRRQILVPDESGPRFARHMYQKPASEKWSRFMALVSRDYVIGIRLCYKDSRNSTQVEKTDIVRYNTFSYTPVRYWKHALQSVSFSSHLSKAVSSSPTVLAKTAAPCSTSSRTMSILLHDAAQWRGVLDRWQQRCIASSVSITIRWEMQFKDKPQKWYLMSLLSQNCEKQLSCTELCKKMPYF